MVEFYARYAPMASIILNVVGAIFYGIAGDWRKTIYWLAAAILTATITF